MQKFMLSLALVLFGGFWISNVQVSQSEARVIIKEKTKFYRITGSNGVEIYKSMLRNGPDHGGKTRDVLASTSFKFDFKNDVFTVHKNHCKLTNLDIIVNVTYTYPKWRGSKKLLQLPKKPGKNSVKLQFGMSSST